MRFEIIGKEEKTEHTCNIVVRFDVFSQKNEYCQINTRAFLMAKQGYDLEGIAARGDF